MYTVFMSNTIPLTLSSKIYIDFERYMVDEELFIYTNQLKPDFQGEISMKKILVSRFIFSFFR